MLTCGHIFRDSQGKGQIAVDLFTATAPAKTAGPAGDLRPEKRHRAGEHPPGRDGARGAGRGKDIDSPRATA